MAAREICSYISTQEGVSSVANLLLMKSLNKIETHFLIRSVFFVSKGNRFDVYSDILSNFRLFSWTEKPIDLKLNRKHRADL